MKEFSESLAGENRSPQLLAVSHIGFVLTGVVTTLLGPVIPALSARWLLADAQAGALFTAQFAGSMIGVAASSWLIVRFGFNHSLSGSFGLMAAGVAGLAAGPWSAGMLSVLIYGMGLGVTIPATNLLISEMNPTRRAAALNLLNLAWGAGAVLCPPIIALQLRAGGLLLPLAELSTLLALVAIWLHRSHWRGIGNRSEEEDRVQREADRIWKSPFLPLVGGLVFLYVGTENAIAGWGASYALRLQSSSRYFWALVPSAFWAALLFGRAVAPLVLRKLADDELVLTGLVLATGGAWLLFNATTPSGLLAGVLCAGAGLASVFPTIVAALPRCFGEGAVRINGLIFAFAGLGGATIPWSVGFLSTRFGSLRIGLLVPLLGNLGMLALQVAIMATFARREKISGRRPGH